MLVRVRGQGPRAAVDNSELSYRNTEPRSSVPNPPRRMSLKAFRFPFQVWWQSKFEKVGLVQRGEAGEAGQARPPRSRYDLAVNGDCPQDFVESLPLPEGRYLPARRRAHLTNLLIGFTPKVSRAIPLGLPPPPFRCGRRWSASTQAGNGENFIAALLTAGFKKATTVRGTRVARSRGRDRRGLGWRR